jgi:predicted Fe-Mo cluster-binding NifX family protein
MKIAVASQNRRAITGHTGRCRKFWIYDIGREGKILGKQLMELARSQSFHESSPHDPHPLQAVQVLISGGMGQGMQRRLAAMGIEAVVTSHSDPDIAVSAWLDGSLDRLPLDAGHVHHVAHPHSNGHSHRSQQHGGCTGCRG